MHHLLSIIATLSLASAVPLPQYDFLATPDSSTPDISTPDISTPDISTPDISTPDISTPDISTPDISTPDIFTGDPWGVTSIDTANANTYLPNSPILLAENPQHDTSVDNQGSRADQPATPKRPKLDTAWDGKDRIPHDGDRSGMGDSPRTGRLGQSAEDYWAGRGFPRVYGLGDPATPTRDGGSAPPPLPINEAGGAGTATLLLDGIIKNIPVVKEGY